MEKRLPAIIGGKALSDKPLSIVRPTFPRSETFKEKFNQALKTGQVTNHGRYVIEFEKKLSQYLGTPVVTAVNGQTALMMMLRGAGINSGEVIVPSYTFCATPHAVEWCGAKPVFADIVSKSSLCLDPSDAEKQITADTRAILAVDVYGFACDYDAFEKIGRKYGIKILYDSAPAFGTCINGQPIGRYGDAQTFSFHATKAFSTMEGGCVSTSDPVIKQRIENLRNFSQNSIGDCEEPGINGKMQEICAIIGLMQLEKIDQYIKHRNHIADLMHQGLAKVPGINFADVTENQQPAWLYFPIVIDPEITGIDRNLVAEALARENLYVRKYFDLPCHQMKAYFEQNRKLQLENTEFAAANVISLPIYNDMTEKECELFVDGITNIIKHAKEIKNSKQTRS